MTAPLDFPAESDPSTYHSPSTANLADILERILDKGIVIAGDIKIDLLDIELLTIRLRLFISSVETAKKAGIDWWETDPALSSRAAENALARENKELRAQLAELEAHDERPSGRARSKDTA
ncbi:putative gas vesicle synthesis protein [Actinacidiphila reveromycinica]|uniref:Putative gas vesicle synthesis protein n=1 Tax=Actinacidiphila reveromycinica TaxID=659352 RepID=A0A7U3UMR4_9ACTN|nr:gas vesicle protein [Streptomyces sp. SN-593]BBA95423.1 putative gas vesicle synthesis protein [Streptomyces sp. SN-593]